MGSTFRLGRIFGIPIGLHWSLLIILLWILVDFAGVFEDITADQTSAFLYASAFAVLFYLSILLHELGHALAARRSNIEITGIDLWMLGGIAKMGRDADTPGTEFKVAAAGPLVTLLIVVGLVVGITAGYGETVARDSLDLKASPNESAMPVLLGFLASFNILLLVFNLIPAFPLDGGRITRSIAWKITGDRAKGTKFAATLGQGFGYLMIGFGAFRAISGDLFGAVIWVFLGMFISGSARDAVQTTAVLSRLEGIRVADVMDAEPVAVPGGMTVAQAMNEFFLRYRYPWFPVVGGDGRYIGLVELERAQSVAEDKQATFKINEIMQAEGDQYRIGSEDPLEALLTNEPLRRLGALMAVDRDGLLKGIVTIDQINRALQGSPPPPAVNLDLP